MTSNYDANAKGACNGACDAVLPGNSGPRSGHTLTAAFTVLTELCDPSPKETKIGTAL